MSGVSNFLRSYDFLHLTKSVTESQMALYKQPNESWSTVGSKFCSICWYNCESIATVGLDVVTYLAVSTLRGCGLFLPLPPPPPTFPTPHDNSQFVQYAIERALWNWDPALRKEFEEGIETSLSDKWNVFQAVGEWSLAYSYENAEKSSYYKPTFLTISEPLENGESFLSVGKAFARLREKDRTAILNALYRQGEAPSLSSSGKKVYQDIRSLASKLHQGNQIYLNAFGEYVKKKDAGSLVAPSPIDAPPVYRPVDEALPVYQPIFDRYEPIAPSAPVAHSNRDFTLMTDDVQFLNRAVVNAVNGLDSFRKKSLIKSVIDDRSRPLNCGYRPATLSTWSPESSPKYFVARLSMIRFFKDGFQKNRMADCPTFFPWNETLRNGKSLREAGVGFADLSDRDFKQLQDAIANPFHSRLNGNLKEKLLELSEFADILHRNEDFLKTYEALRIDLVAS